MTKSLTPSMRSMRTISPRAMTDSSLDRAVQVAPETLTAPVALRLLMISMTSASLPMTRSALVWTRRGTR